MGEGEGFGLKVTELVLRVGFTEHSILPEEPSNILSLLAVEAFHAPQRVCANFDADWNMPCMVVTLDTSHLEMSPLKDLAK